MSLILSKMRHLQQIAKKQLAFIGKTMSSNKNLLQRYYYVRSRCAPLVSKLKSALHSLNQHVAIRVTVFQTTLSNVIKFVRNRRAKRMAHRPALRISWGRFAFLACVAISFAFFALDPRFGPKSFHENPMLLEFAQTITHFGKSDWILYPSGFFLIFSGFLDWKKLHHQSLAAWSNRTQIAWFCFLAVGGSGLIAVLLKQAIGRARPPLFEEHGLLFFNNWTFGYDYASFPSGHATTAAAFCTVIALLCPRLRFIAATVLLWTAASRSLIHVHYPSDVIAGSALGIWFTYFTAAQFAKSGLLFTLDKNTNLRPKRGLFWINQKYERALKQRLKQLEHRLRGDDQSISIGTRAN